MCIHRHKDKNDFNRLFMATLFINYANVSVSLFLSNFIGIRMNILL
jgi:hypothetical protein